VFAGNDVVTLFDFGFKVFDQTQLAVEKTNLTTHASTFLTLGADYTVSLNGDQDNDPGGTVTLLDPLATGYELQIISDVPYTQLTKLINAGGFYPSVINDEFDKLTMLILQNKDVIDYVLQDVLSSESGRLQFDVITNVYSPTDSAGKTGVLIKNYIPGGVDHYGVEGYSQFIESRPFGSRDGAVPGSDFCQGLSMIKDAWQTTSEEGQTCGQNIVVRGGYHGTNITEPWFTPGDSAGIIVNTVNSASQCFNAILEGVSYHMPNGSFATGTHGIRCQIGAIKKDQAIGIGYLAVAENGGLGAAFQAQNTIGHSAGDGFWTEAFNYIFNPGTGPYEAFKINQAGHIIFNSGGVTTPKKTLRVGAGGKLEMVNDAGSSVVFNVSDGGMINVAAGGGFAINNEQVLNSRIAGWGSPTGNVRISSFNGSTATLSQTAQVVAQLITDLKVHGLLGV
jgi:hypothetical protein